MDNPINILWFRQDLRLQDNLALTAAAQDSDATILPIYILDDENSHESKMGSASRVWLHHSLNSLNRSLDGKLSVYYGDAHTILNHLVKQYQVNGIYWNRCYEPWRVARDTNIKKDLLEQGICVNSFNASLLWEPWEIFKNDGTAYKVFTPFYRRGCLNAKPPREPLKAQFNLNLHHDSQSMAINALNLLPKISWDKPIMSGWEIGEQAASNKLDNFLDEGILNYKEFRNYPAKSGISRLSPHLHFGEISPNQIWYAATMRGDNDNIDCFCSELAWREFSYSLLYYNNNLPTQNLQAKFDNFPWNSNSDTLLAWQHGQTGIPIVDAGMRELWHTGFMHNRVRMIVGSFLVKNLLLHWQHGERWFWECLFDADLASNSASWQWVAGCGADAAPYFRIFNPITQGQKFDTDGIYTRRFVPELANMPDKYLFNPWEASAEILANAGVELGKTYPFPIVNLANSRDRALAAFKSLGAPTL